MIVSVKRLLLSREAFKTQVFTRSKQFCVLCGVPAVDAHHILERKLFEDGGYYLDNGAAVRETSLDVRDDRAGPKRSASRMRYCPPGSPTVYESVNHV